MKTHIAEFVSPGHPDRLADAVVESCVALAISRDPDALVGLECAVHTDMVFLDGRIAGGRGAPCVTPEELEGVVRDVYRAAGYGGKWIPAPEALRIVQNVCLEALSDDERAIRTVSDDQNVVMGYACNSPATDYLPVAPYVANALGRRLAAWRAGEADRFGPDFKVLVSLCEEGGGRWRWNRLTVSIQHAAGVYAGEQHAAVRPVADSVLEGLEARGLAGLGELPAERFILNGAGDFIVGGPEGDNGLSGKKLVVDFYGPEVPIGGGAICGKDPHKVDVCGAFRARQLALDLVRRQGAAAATVRLGWTPGDAMPAYREALLQDSLGFQRPLPDDVLPPADWFSIEATVHDLDLVRLDRRRRMLDGYFTGPMMRGL